MSNVREIECLIIFKTAKVSSVKLQSNDPLQTGEAMARQQFEGRNAGEITLTARCSKRRKSRQVNQLRRRIYSLILRIEIAHGYREESKFEAYDIGIQLNAHEPAKRIVI